MSVALPAVLPKKVDAATLSQWQLISLNFAKHHLAVWSMYILVVLYLMAIFAEVVAPSVPNRNNLDHAFCPPQLLRWSWTNGVHVRPLTQRLDPITLRRTYIEETDKPIPVGLFARGESYDFWGLFPTNIHL
ncbi:MAG: peptide transporter permease, partial [Phycisphaerales bacterium]|nr:peptide transporter permease [Phycisphaerales bacterium]